jgi:hypothetical protein
MKQNILPWWILAFDFEEMSRLVHKFLKGGMPPRLTQKAIDDRLAEVLGQVHYGRKTGYKTKNNAWDSKRRPSNFPNGRAHGDEANR